MRRKHTQNKKAKRPYTGVLPNKFYNWKAVTVSIKNIKKDLFLPPYAKRPIPTYKNK